jgi:hypothetical protein
LSHCKHAHLRSPLLTDLAPPHGLGPRISSGPLHENLRTIRPILSTRTTAVRRDHTGGHGLFDCIAVHPNDEAWLSRGLPSSDEEVRHTLMREPFLRQRPRGFDPQKWHPFRGEPTDLIVDGQRIDLGSRSLIVTSRSSHRIRTDARPCRRQLSVAETHPRRRPGPKLRLNRSLG